MPVTRSSTRQDSRQPSIQPCSPRRAGPSGSTSVGTKKSSKSPSNEIIVLSSDDDEPPPKGSVAAKRASSKRALRKKTGPSAAPPVHLGDILEISSDDEDRFKRRSPRKQVESVEKKSKELERTVKKLQEDLASASKELEDHKRRGSDRDVMSGLEEHISCEVCNHTMLCPYILPECGHTFCENCLTHWFGTIQASHLTSNPGLDNNRAALAGQLHALVQMVPNLHAYSLHGQNHLRAILAELRRHRPEYTCPSCRRAVLNKPVENFKLKALIHDIAEMFGEMNTPKAGSSHRACAPFDNFFAAPITTR